MLRAMQLAVACLAVAVAGQVQAGIITLTGAELNSDPKASFPGTRSRTVIGTSLSTGTASGFNEVLFLYDLFPAGTLTGSSPTETYTVSLNLTRDTSDHDIFYGLWDGTNYLTVTSWDGNRSARYDAATSNGSTFAFLGLLGSTLYSSSFGVGSSFNTGVEFSLASSGPSFHAILPDGSDGPTVTTATFDRTATISLLVGINSSNEQTTINSLSIEGPSIGSAAPVPEPTSLALLATGAFGFMGYGWRRKRKQAA